ncbi:hypothetical protein K8O93_17880 [Gordonia bronchialis]|uniref:hypothetical protein n=1 Tax=Gordonia bronchialis TaxID=2054 RepID=UPI001CBE59BA|nr:hypothetical protein [Gordonia bronchialis]UAK37035.1 hypothetical protein K8O93_17880 [Gordonia bronchialis]
MGKMVGNATWLRLLAPSAPVGTTARRRVLRQLADADVRALLQDRTDIRPLCPTLFYRNWFGARWRYAHRHVFTVTLPTALPGLTIGPNLHTRTRGEHIIFDDDDGSDFARYLPVFSPAPDVARRVLTRSVRDRLGDLAARSSVVRITVFVVVGDKLHAVWLNTSQPQDLTDVAEGLRILVAALEANSKL